jgi:hypothetical protein
MRIGHSSCSASGLFSHKRMESHGSDADDESTDMSGENLNSSNELCIIPNKYCVSSGTKPLSLVIRRFRAPTTENSFSSVLKRDTSMSSPLSKEFERNSDSGVLTLERKANESHFQKGVSITCNAINSNLEEFDNELVPTASGVSVGTLQEVILSLSQESTHSGVTHEYVENIVNGNDLCVDMCSTHNVENGLNFDYTDDSTLLQSKPMFKNYSSDNADENVSLSLVCSQDMCGRVENANIDKNQHSLHPLKHSENIQSLIHTLPPEHCKQKGEVSIHGLFEEVPGRNTVGSAFGILESEEYQEMNAVDTTKCESKIPAAVTLETDSFHMREQSEYAENTNDLNLRAQPETFVVEGEFIVESTVMESPINEIHETEGIARVDDSLKCENSESQLLRIKGGNTNEIDSQTEGGREVNTIVHHNTEVSVGRNLFDEEDHFACAEKSDEIKGIEVICDENGTAVLNDTVKSKTQIEIADEPLTLLKIDHNVDEIKVNMLQDASFVNVMRNAVEFVFPLSLACAQSSSQCENYEKSWPVNHTEKRQTFSVEDEITVQKHVQCSFDNEGETRTESGVCCSPKNPLPLTGMNAIQICGNIAKDQLVSVKAINDITAEVTKNSGCSSVLMDKSSKNIVAVASADCVEDHFLKMSKADVSQSHNSTVLVQSYTKNTLDCSYNGVSSDADHVEHSPLLFSSDDEESYYIGKVLQNIDV